MRRTPNLRLTLSGLPLKQSAVAPSLSAIPYAPAMKASCLRIVVAIALAVPARAVEGQRLAPALPTYEPTPFLLHNAHLSTGVAPRDQPRDCRQSSVLLVAAGTVGGAAGGWLAYEVPIGIWISAEGASSQPFARHLRNTLVVTGAVLGALRAAYIARHCRSNSAGA